MKILKYRKPSFWICLLCVVAIIGAAVFFLTDPLKEMTMEDYVSLIGMEKNELLDKLGVDEEDATYSETSRLHLLPKTVQFNGREYQIYCDMGEGMHNYAASFKFVSKSNEDVQISIEDFASEYLALQAQFTEQFGESRRTIIYSDAQQIVDAYENRRRSEVGAWVIDTPWEVYEGIPYSNIIEFLKEMLTWDEVIFLGKWHGRDMDGLLRVSLQGEYLDGSAVFKINYRADVMPASTAVKNNTVFTNFASKLGMHKDAFLEELDAEGDVTHSDGGDVWLEPVETLGTKWYISTVYSPEQQQVMRVEFRTDKTTNFDDNAAHYLNALAILKQAYGEPTMPGASTLEELRESYDGWTNKAGGVWPETTSWRIEDIGFIHPQLQERLEEQAKTEPVSEAMKWIYGSDVKFKPSFMISLVCSKGTDGNCRTSVTIAAGVVPDK